MPDARILSDAELSQLELLLAEAQPAPWHVVEAPWRPRYYDRDSGMHRDLPTYVVSGSQDPHLGKPVVEAPDTDEEGNVPEACASDADLYLTAAARNALPHLIAEIKAWRNWKSNA